MGREGLVATVDEGEVLDRLVAWARGEPRVRALILTSSRARPDGPVDALSDYDVIIAVAHAEAFSDEDGWVSGYGRPMVRWGDQGVLCGLTSFFHGVVYEDGVKVDYTVAPDELLERVSASDELPEALDVGYRVLLDRDARTTGWRRPSFRAHVPHRPTEAEYRALVEQFWWDATYVAKSLWRGELMPAKFSLDHDLKLVALRRVLEWHVELGHDWSLKAGRLGRGLERLLPPEVWAELASTYVGPDPDDNWAALFRTGALFRRVATSVGEALGYAYPQKVDEGVTAYLHGVQALPRPRSAIPRR